MTPWSASDARVTAVAGIVGWALLAAAWWGSSGTGRSGHQTTWLIVGVAAVVVMALGAGHWLHVGRHAIHRRRNAVFERLDLVAPVLPVSHDDDVARRAWVATPAGDRYHRDDCLLARGKDVQSLVDGSPALAARRPCEMCCP